MVAIDSWAMRSLVFVALILFQVAAPAETLSVEGTEWVLDDAAGRVWRSSQLVGAEFHLENDGVVRIDRVEQLSDANHQPFWAHHLSLKTSQTKWVPFCKPHNDGSSYALLFSGRQLPDGRMLENKKSFVVSCSSGALAKCLRFGYRPWEAQNGEVSALNIFNACVRMVRADYGGDGKSHTRNGTQIDIYDFIGIQRPDLLAGQAFEAGWTADGAVCVRHARVPLRGGLHALASRYKQLRARIGPVCTQEFARQLGAVIFNRS